MRLINYSKVNRIDREESAMNYVEDFANGPALIPDLIALRPTAGAP